jgi:ATP-dependent helicase YprA (DUF1998 family)
MQLTPSQAFEHIKESAIQYLETAYKIAHPFVYAERGRILRENGSVAQAPFVEATPAFPTARKLSDLERAYPETVPTGLAELVQHGVPVDRFALYTHQEASILKAYSDQPDLLVASGTGSGKTECFLLPILADLLREARGWTAPAHPPQRGVYDARNNIWLHARRHETRPAALRGIILYPMNALVNDQLSRLRRILARKDSPDWQRRNLNGNVIHFGMYTSLTPPTGSWSEEWRREKYDQYRDQIEQDWQKLREDLRDTGMWPRPDSPEMLCRWDMQAAPPDILVTNYSMLEYMLVRPVEYPIFQRTREWLQQTPDAHLTLVLDEAHTYTGAKGTEVAFLVRRLKERLGLTSGSPQFRAIATTASVPGGADDQLKQFTSDLFGEPPERFSLIRIGSTPAPDAQRRPQLTHLQAFGQFQNTFNLQDPFPAIEQIARDLELGLVDRSGDPQVELYRLLESSPDIAWVRNRTARNATPVTTLAEGCWPGLADPEARERATAGVLAAGSFARAMALADTPPLLSMRVHAFFRGIPGLWACMNPQCPEVDPAFQSADRPIGKLYVEPRPWCSPRCGGRVLELFSCRHCGLLFLGGIPDNHRHSLWPWSDDLSGQRQDPRQFQIFGVEAPAPEYPADYRSIRTTLATHPNEPTARVVYEIEPAKDGDQQISNFPAQCPRCQNYRALGRDGREVIEPLRTKGPRTFSVVMEDAFRVQPPSAKANPPNYGRKALLFTDSRMEAAQLAGDITQDHHDDVFRQLLYRALYLCPSCAGTGLLETKGPYVIGQEQKVAIINCPQCQGSGSVAQPSALTFAELRTRVIQLELARGIDASNGNIEGFFAKLEAGDQLALDAAQLGFHLGLRRELAEDEFSLEPLGLASWRVNLPAQIGNFVPLTEAETRIFLRSIARLLATENILLAPNPQQPWDWPHDRVKDYERQVIIPGYARSGRAIPYNLQPRRKLGRYVISVARALVREGRLSSGAAAKKWVSDLHWELWKALRGFNILQWAGAKINNEVPQGIRIDSFELHPVGPTVECCTACAYVMSEALLSTCIRCGQQTRSIPAADLQNYYRRAALHALPGSGLDDPYPLRAIEHTAQIGREDARNFERWFQDLFHDNQNPKDYRIDILSVTTTMEMGIDIGSLLSVGLRNVPPTVANYQQRAGRAGRRGSAIATVLTFAQFRSHDQYYFDRPPEIVSQPPRVPALYLDNRVIALRHIRSVALQHFFHAHRGAQNNGHGLFQAWGTVADFANQGTANRLRQFLATNRAPLLARCAQVLPQELASEASAWLDALPGDVQQVVQTSDANDDLLEAVVRHGLLPKYAFPVDVVSLSIPNVNVRAWNSESDEGDAMQRDLAVALGEYAPGSEVIRGDFPNVYIYRSAGLYDAFERHPDYHPTGVLFECADCQSVDLLQVGDPAPIQCPECGSFEVQSLPFIRPRGFTVDASLPDMGRERYERGGRERAGFVSPARLLVGETSFNVGQSQTPFAPHLYTHLRIGNLFTFNKGPDPRFPGFLICPDCGRALDPDDPVSHTYPANVPPHVGRNRGPRAGSRCSCADFTNQIILGHEFHSEVVLLGTDLPDTLDAPFWDASGRAVWTSFGTLVATAAALYLQVDPGELKVGTRAVRRAPGRIHAEVFLYDDVPGGAGYARAISANLEPILRKALELGEHCSNPRCSGACYHCLYDYRNQAVHPLLDRELGSAVLRFILSGQLPVLDPQRVEVGLAALAEFAQDSWIIQPGFEANGRHFPLVLADSGGERIGLLVIHPLQARPSRTETQSITAQHHVRCAVHTSFDLERRPFWVLNNLVGPA